MEPLDQRWPRQVPADLEAEAKRLLQWANSDAAWRGPPPASSAAPNPSVAVRGASAAAGSSYLGGCEDPFAELLAQSDGVASGFCEVPVMLLRRIRAEGQAQLAEIAELRAQLAKLPEVEEEVAEMEAELQELQTNCVVNANEIELRKMEAETLASEAVRLKDEKQQRMKRLEALTAQDEAKSVKGYFNMMINTISAQYDLSAYLDMLANAGKFIMVGLPSEPLSLKGFGIVGERKMVAGSKIGNIKETQDMLDFCAKHGITCPHELIPADPAKVNEAYERAIKSDVRYRFADEIEFWLDAAGHAPAGPEGRARVERYRAAAQQAAQQAKAATASAASAAPGGAGSAASAAESGPAEAAAAGSALRGSADVPVLTLEQWKELGVGGTSPGPRRPEKQPLNSPQELDAFFARINPTGRATTPPELLAAAGNPKLGLARHLRGLVAKVVSQQGKPTAEGETAAKPGEAENASATAVPAEAAAAKAEKASPPAPEPHGSKGEKASPPAPDPVGSKAEKSPAPLPEQRAEAEEEAEEDAFTKEEWLEFFQDDEEITEEDVRDASIPGTTSATTVFDTSPERSVRIDEDLGVLDDLLDKMDTSGDGQLSPQEISEALADPNFKMPEAIRAKLIDFMKNVG
eukprot:g28191.t1